VSTERFREDRRQKNPTPAEVIDLQIQAYNERDVVTFCSFYASDAHVTRLNDGAEVCGGHESIRTLYARLFKKSPDLRCEVISRIELGCFVVDHERVTGIGDKTSEGVVIYEVRDQRIQMVRILRTD